MNLRATTALLVATAAITLGAGSSSAGQNSGAKILIHVAPHTTKNNCTRAAALPPCSGVVTTGQLNVGYDAYLLVVDGNATAGVGGLQCGIQYPATFAVDWALCGTLEFSSTGWPSSGGGNLITWDTSNRCQRSEPGGTNTGVVATAGYFYMAAYGPGNLTVTTRPVDGLAKVGDCASQPSEDIIAGTGGPSGASRLGFASFGGGTGYRPCGQVVPVEASTWSAIKGAYRK